MFSRIRIMNLYFSMFLAILLSQILFTTLYIGNVYADSLNPEIYSTGESPFGIPYSTWIARWLNWSAGIPSDQHPRDFAERSCNVNQIWEDVWFLPDILDGKIVRECDIPHGKAIFVPITTGWQGVAESEEFKGKPLDDIRDSLIKGASYCDNYNVVRIAEIDGKKIQGLEGNTPYRTNTSELFNLTYSENNIYGIKPGTAPAFGEGWFLFVKPLSQGDHTIKIASKISNPTDFSCDYSGETEWNVKIE